MRVWNLTPHAVRYENDQVSQVFLSDCVARAVQVDLQPFLVAGLVVVKRHYDGVEGVPTGVADGDTLIVSTILADAMIASNNERWKKCSVLVPDTGPSCSRNPDGTVAFVSQFVLKT